MLSGKSAKIINIICIVIITTCAAIATIRLLPSDSQPQNLNSFELIAKAFIKGDISPDDYVQQTAYAMYDRSLLDKKYQTKSDQKALAPHLMDMLSDNFADLTETTIEYIVEKIFLAGSINFDTDASSNPTTTNSPQSPTFSLSPSAYADSSHNVITLNKAILSEDGHFLIWYTDTGNSRISDAQAKKIADQLDESVKGIQKTFGLEFQYKAQLLASSLMGTDTGNIVSAGNMQSRLLKNRGIDPVEASRALPVYVMDYNDNDSTPAFYAKAPTTSNVVDLITNVFLGLINRSEDISGISYAPTLPYMMVGTKALESEDDSVLISTHELFHHYQKYYCGDGKYSECQSKSFTIETTANFVAATLYSPSSTNTMLNDYHVSTYLKNVFAPIDTNILLRTEKASGFLAWIDGKNGDDEAVFMSGYHYFTFMHSYAKTIPNGVKKSFDSLKHKDALKFLYDSANGDFDKVLKKLAETNLTNDYPSNAMKSELKPAQNQPLSDGKKILHKKIENITINQMAMNYFYLPMNLFKDKTIEISTSSSDLSVVILGQRSGNYELISTKDITGSIEIVMADHENFTEIVIAVINSNYDQKGLYSISTTSVSAKPEEEKPSSGDVEIVQHGSVYYTQSSDHPSAIGNPSNAAIIFKNNKKESVQVTLEVSFYGKDGSVLDKHNVAVSPLEPKQEFAYVALCNSCSKYISSGGGEPGYRSYDHYSHYTLGELKVSPANPAVTPRVSDVNITHEKVKDQMTQKPQLVVSATNKSTTKIDYISSTTVFFKAGKIFDAWTYTRLSPLEAKETQIISTPFSKEENLEFKIYTLAWNSPI